MGGHGLGVELLRAAASPQRRRSRRRLFAVVGLTICRNTSTKRLRGKTEFQCLVHCDTSLWPRLPLLLRKLAHDWE